MRLTMRFDMRQPDPTSDRPGMYAAAIDMCEWADGLDFDEVYLCEHHGAEDGYLPQPMMLAAGVAARTRRMTLHISAMLATLQHPLHLAEQAAVLDLISNGRVRITAGMAYRAHEFEMFGVDVKKKLRIYLDAIETIQKAWRGEWFEYEGKRVQITPPPVQPGGPVISMGGSVEAAALRAARLGFEFMPGHPGLYEVYKAELARMGKPEPRVLPNQKPNFLFVTDDPERDWPVVGPHVLYTVNCYARWAAERGVGATQYAELHDISELRGQLMYQVVTPDECVEFAKSLGPHGELMFQPLFGGLDPAVAWKSLKLFEQAVLPRLRSAGLRPPAP